MEKNLIITIGRQLGSGGKQIGEHLSQALQIPCYDKELIMLASQESGLGKEFFEKADEKSRHNFFNGILGYTGLVGDYSTNYLCNEALFQIQSDVIRNLAEKKSCIFIGRCADYILRDHPRVFSIFIHANQSDRIQRIKESCFVSEKEAQSRIEHSDKIRAGYYNYYSNKIWGMSISYDLCINSSVLGVKATAPFILSIVSQLL